MLLEVVSYRLFQEATLILIQLSRQYPQLVHELRVEFIPHTHLAFFPRP